MFRSLSQRLQANTKLERAQWIAKIAALEEAIFHALLLQLWSGATADRRKDVAKKQERARAVTKQFAASGQVLLQQVFQACVDSNIESMKLPSNN